VKGHQHKIGPARARFALHRHDDGLEPAVERHALGILHALLLAAGAGAAYGLDQLGHPQSQRHRLAPPQRRRQEARAVVERQHARVAVECDHRIRQPGNERPERVVRSLGNRNRPDQAADLVARTHDENSRGGHHGEAGDSVAEAQRADGGQSGEHDRGGRDHEPLAAPSASQERDAVVMQSHSYAFAYVPARAPIDLRIKACRFFPGPARAQPSVLPPAA
jgi:hypothetical protein